MSSELSPEQVEVVVVGAGLSGLCAAEELAVRGHDVLVLEASEQLGGRTRTATALGLTLDCGGAYIGQRHTEVRQLADRLGIPLQRTVGEGASLFDLAGRLHRSEGEHMPFSALAFGLALDRIEELAGQVDLHSPGASPDAEMQDRITVHGWLRAEEMPADAGLLIEQIVREMLALDPDEVSLLHFLFYVKSGGGLPFLTAFAGGAQEFRLVGGVQGLCERLATRLDRQVRTGSAVRRVTQTAGSVQVHADGLRVECSQLVLATGPGQERSIELDLSTAHPPVVPASKGGSAVKVHLVYRTAFWRNSGLSGWVTADRPPIRFLVDDSNGRDGLGVLVGFLTGAEARAWSRDSVTWGDLTARLAEWLGTDALEPLHVQAQDWLREPWVQGCYAAVPELGAWAGARSNGRPGGFAGPIHRVGSEYSPYFYGHLEGAVRSARAVVQQVARGDIASSGVSR
jgi:monoamine oxidase